MIKLIMAAIVTFFLWLIFGALIAHWYKTNIDYFWIALSVYGILLILFLSISTVEIRNSEEEVV